MICSGTGQQIQDYIDGVLSGEIIVSGLVRAAVQRHVNDLARQSTEGFPYHFDADWGNRVCEFFPSILKHSIGEFSGLAFHLQPWQMFIVSSVYGWKRDEDNSRRFRRVFLSVARKNGKSSFAAGLCIFAGVADIDPHTGKPEAVGQILISATKRDQAQVVFDEAERMRRASPSLSKHTTHKYSNIYFNHSQSYVRTIGSDKPFDGLNPSLVIMDELHAWREFHRKFYDTMVTGGAARTQPLQVSITTAGDEQSHIYLEEYEYAAGCCQGTVKDESVFGFICELDEKDDPFDESVWPKANPNLGVSVKLDYLRQQAREAKQKAIARNRFIRYHANRIVTSFERAITADLWDACGTELTNWDDADAITAAFDLGGRDDLAAFALCARFPFGEKDDKPIWRYEIIAKAYITTEAERDLLKQPWCNWIADGHLTACPFPMASLRDDLIEQCKIHGIRQVAFDPFSAQQMREELTLEGLECISVTQNCNQFNEPIHELLQAMTDRRLSHGNLNPVLRWCALNAVISRNKDDRWMFDKSKAKDKIDPIVAVAMALKPCLVAPPRTTGSLYL